MITPSYVQAMAAYNTVMNQRLYAAAAGLDDAARKADRGAFWKSIHGTFSHLAWADRQWMSRFDGWEKPPVPMARSADLYQAFDAMRTDRTAFDSRIEAWAKRVDEGWLSQDLVWFSGAAQREMHRPRGLLVAHFFNHQTHHRGQAHAMLTAAGQVTGDTDLMLLA